MCLIGEKERGEKGGLHQNISKVLINASNNIEIFFLSKFEVFESNIFCRIGATEGGILSKYSKVLTVLRQLADRHLADHGLHLLHGLERGRDFRLVVLPWNLSLTKNTLNMYPIYPFKLYNNMHWKLLYKT